MLLLLITVALTLPLFTAMGLAALALLDPQKRDTTPFLTPALASCGGKSQYMPVGLWHVHCLAATCRRGSLYGNEG